MHHNGTHSDSTIDNSIIFLRPRWESSCKVPPRHREDMRKKVFHTGEKGNEGNGERAAMEGLESSLALPVELRENSLSPLW